MNKDIISEIDLIIEKVKKSNEYIDYINILNKVNKSNDIKDLTNEIRQIQKELVKTPSIKLEKLLQEKNKELNNIPYI